LECFCEAREGIRMWQDQGCMMIRRVLAAMGLAAVLVLASTASAAIIHLRIDVDKPAYAPEDMVTWTVRAWASAGDNRGIALLGVDLTESAGEALNPALVDIVQADPLIQQLHQGAYGHAQGFELAGAGTYDPDVPGVLSEVGVFQFPFDAVLDQGSDGQQHVFATGSYAASVLGTHQITPALTSTLYWADTLGTSHTFETTDLTSATFTVTPEPATMALLALGGLLLRRNRRF